MFDSTLDPTLLSGWGVRSGDWQWGASVQQQILPRMSAELSYLRRWLVNFPVLDNRARAPEDHTSFGVVAPTDSRLPNGGGYTVAGLYNPTAAADEILIMTPEPCWRMMGRACLQANAVPRRLLW